MAKGQQRSNREAKKPKKDKAKVIAAAPSRATARQMRFPRLPRAADDNGVLAGVAAPSVARSRATSPASAFAKASADMGGGGNPGGDAQQQVQKLTMQLQAMQADRQIDAQKLQVEMYRAETDRMKANSDIAARMNPGGA